jgi:hypothetical protein
VKFIGKNAVDTSGRKVPGWTSISFCGDLWSREISHHFVALTSSGKVCCVTCVK